MSDHAIQAFVTTAIRLCGDSPTARSALAGGITSVTSHRALPYVYEYVADARHHDLAVRVGGLIGFHKNVDRTSSESFGANMRNLTKAMTKSVPRADAPDRVALTLASIQNQRLDQAVMSVNRLIGLAVTKGIPINFHSVADLFTYWGHGVTEGSRKARARALRDYYTYNEKSTEKVAA